MHNKAMEQKLRSGEAIDVNSFLLSPAEQGADGSYTYYIKYFLSDMDYCDAKRELWIWSIGENKSDGTIIAATDARYYQNEYFDCLFLR